MKEVFSKEEFKKYMEWKGEGRGLTFKLEIDFIRKMEGEEGVKKVEQAISKAGYPIKYSQTRALQYYPIGVEILTLVAIKRIFNYEDKKFQEIGAFAIKDPLISRGLFISKNLLTLKRIQQVAPVIWNKYYLFGELNVIEYSDGERWLIARFENFHHHYLNWEIVKGGLIGVLEVIYGKKMNYKETKSIFKGDEYNELLIKW